MTIGFQTSLNHHSPMATPRSQLVDTEVPLHYHLVSRCVRRSYLCGHDRTTGKDYNHRKAWFKERLFHLAKYFPVAVDAFSILDNHFHLVVYYDPKECQRWSDEELVFRWTEVFPSPTKTKDAEVIEALKIQRRAELLTQPERLQQIRKTLGSLSSFMKHLKQPIAWRANREDDCYGHFFEGRFYSGALLSEEAVLAAMAYVDLNQVRAKIARNIQQCRDSSIFERLQVSASTPERLEQSLQPLVSGIIDTSRRISMNLQDYIEHLNLLVGQREEPSDDVQAIWYKRVASIRKRQRAYGTLDELKGWLTQRGW